MNVDQEPEPRDERDGELDGLRIRQHAALRRAAYRSRSHAIVAMLVCLVAVLQSAILLIQQLVHVGFDWHIPVYGCVAIAGAYGTWFFFHRAVALHRETKQSHLPAPTANPDFSTLSDGSQRWKNLEDLH